MKTLQPYSVARHSQVFNIWLRTAIFSSPEGKVSGAARIPIADSHGHFCRWTPVTMSTLNHKITNTEKFDIQALDIS